MPFSLSDLDHIISSRKDEDPATSYTASLVAGGVARCAQKVGEEATETIIAALQENDVELVGESADLLYHLLVLLQARKISLDSVFRELEKRTCQSGHAEKAARTKT